ncbi:MAG TPA: type III secretion system export apparatus subunit SctS [Noviherbaspirillum sp.]|jgi:type III secretion protein S|uniref:type III secretion system export apparatus subunit SctS n=1 Tax=Noviherbaspirillum sp. TaxID=1926288 RepID=UPI002F946E56
MADTLHYFQQALWMSILFSAPPLLVATALGLGVSLVQAVTQIQDQTLPYVVKLAAVAVTLTLMGRWIGVEMIRLAELGLAMIPLAGR